ncbi:uncharacterized protein LOC122535327 [Frieseomelitta varia]|uniref:uncharacterized protein LOC122535327 n=1 Tax=Frieseomelitta varia TaxID=561572 RepID=UPI001CB68BB5|nr:uncharacterized protein LOC122535327 [Frieseomelitta varia]
MIYISHDRFLNGKRGGKEDVLFVKKEVLFRRIIQKEVLEVLSYHFLRNVRLQRHYTVKYGIHFLQFSNHDRYFSRSIFKRETWRKGARLICKEGSFIQKNHPERSYFLIAKIS